MTGTLIPGLCDTCEMLVRHLPQLDGLTGAFVYLIKNIVVRTESQKRFHTILDHKKQL